jgi:hypothetical protein
LESSFSNEELGIPTSNPIYGVSSYVSSGIQFDQSTYPITLPSSTIEETWRIEFINSTVYNVKKNNGVTIQSGNIGDNIVTPYFTLYAAGWSGTPTAGSYFQFKVSVSITSPVDRTGYKIENVKDTVIASWMGDADEDGILGKIETTSLTLEIPPCVEDLLETCPDDDSSLKSILLINSSDSDSLYRVYVNSCDGSIIDEGWVDNSKT